MVLHPVARENGRRAVVPVDGQCHRHRPLGQQQAVAVVAVDVEVIGDQAELFAGHVESRVRVDGRGSKHRESYAGASRSATREPTLRFCPTPQLAREKPHRLVHFLQPHQVANAEKRPRRQHDHAK